LLQAQTYSESLNVVHAQLVAEQVEESILEHATVAVAVNRLCQSGSSLERVLSRRHLRLGCGKERAKLVEKLLPSQGKIESLWRSSFPRATKISCLDRDCLDCIMWVDLRENESVSVEPVGVLWVETHELVEKNVGDGSHTHGRTRVARVGFGSRIDL
jgi:hypothetical protein